MVSGKTILISWVLLLGAFGFIEDGVLGAFFFVFVFPVLVLLAGSLLGLRDRD